MSSRHRLDLDASNSRLYVSHPGAARCARIRGDGAEYTLRWGRQ